MPRILGRVGCIDEVRSNMTKFKFEVGTVRKPGLPACACDPPRGSIDVVARDNLLAARGIARKIVLMSSKRCDERKRMDVVGVKREIRFDASRSRFPIADVVTVGVTED